eukprot:2076657-Rhodomonas_salina.2
MQAHLVATSIRALTALVSSSAAVGRFPDQHRFLTQYYLAAGEGARCHKHPAHIMCGVNADSFYTAINTLHTCCQKKRQKHTPSQTLCLPHDLEHQEQTRV